MRVPLPTPEVLRQQRLRQEAQARLAERDAMAAARLGDPTDPGWLLVEEAAWRAETLSTEAGAYSDALALDTVACLGVSPLPASPALGLVLVTPAAHGVLRAAPDDDPTLFLSAHTESRSGIHLVMLEAEAPLLAAGLVPPASPSAPLLPMASLGGLFADGLANPLPGSITLASPATPGATLRLVVQVARGAAPALSLAAGGRDLPSQVSRRITGASDDRIILTASVPEGATELSLSYGSPPPLSLGLNPVLVINAPRAADGRLVELPRVGPARLDPRVGRALSPGALAGHRGRGLDDLLDALELLRVQVPAGEGPPRVELDDRTGAVLLQRDPTAAQPATAATVSWLRQTDGAAGELAVHAVRLVEQAEGTTPVLLRVGNPFPILGGADRERPRDAVRRAYGRGITPLSAFEVGMAEALQAAGLSWRLRLWSASDGRLSEVCRWEELPLVTPATTVHPTSATAAALLQDGVLVAATGPYQGRASPDEERRAADLLQAWFERARGPHPSLRALTVIGLRRLQLVTNRPDQAPQFPTYALGARPSGDTLVDQDGERRWADRDAILLDGVLVGLAPAGGAR